MQVVQFSDARARLKAVMDGVVDGDDATLITRRDAEPVVMISLSEWNAIQATLHLLSTPANATTLRAAIAELDAGAGTERMLVAAAR